MEEEQKQLLQSKQHEKEMYGEIEQLGEKLKHKYIEQKKNQAALIDQLRGEIDKIIAGMDKEQQEQYQQIVQQQEQDQDFQQVQKEIDNIINDTKEIFFQTTQESKEMIAALDKQCAKE